MPYGIVLKDEHRTSNIERKTNIQYQTFNGYFCGNRVKYGDCALNAPLNTVAFLTKYRNDPIYF